MGLYLPPFKSVNIYFMKSVMAREKRAVKTDRVRHIYAPQYDSLSLEKIFAFAVQY